MVTTKDHTLLVEKYRSKTLDSYVGNEHIKKTIEQYLGQNDMYPILMEIGRMGDVGTKPWFGFNIKKETIINMKEAGIIDPAKVTRAALENAASVAGTILLTECVVVEDPDSKDEVDPMAGMMGGMM